MIDFYHSIMTDSLETRTILLILFLILLHFLGWPYRENIKIAKMATCSEDILYGDDFDVFKAIFRSYGFGTNTSEAVEKTVTNKKDYHKYSFCFT